MDPLKKEPSEDPVAELLFTLLSLGYDVGWLDCPHTKQIAVASDARELLPSCFRSKTHNIEQLELNCERLRTALWTQLNDYLEVQRIVAAKGQMINDLVHLRASPPS